ncbi:MAG TPA: rhomboid family intramembrane serine protease [Candidatus Obscuribacterales bacterium]
MFPLRDSNPSQSVPIFNIAIIVINVLVFLFEVSLGERGLNRLFQEFGLVPALFLERFGPFEVVTMFTCMFLHGGWMHLISNMWALYIFGDNIEDRLGHFGYVVFYLLCGVAAGLTQVFMSANSTIPTVGASGAIAGVLGGYVVMFPHARVLTLIPIYIIVRIIEVPAIVYLGVWFLTQFFTGLGTLGARDATEGGVAWWAHIGGFVMGVILVKLVPKRKQVYDYSDTFDV